MIQLPKKHTIDLSAPKPTGVGLLHDVKLKADGEKVSKLIAILSVVFPIEDKDDGLILDRSIPGAARLIAEAANARDSAAAATSAEGAAAGSTAMSGVGGHTVIKPSNPHVVASVHGEGQKEPVLTGITAEIGDAKLRASGRKIEMVLKVRLYDVEIDQLPGLLRRLNKPIGIELERKQLQLFGNKPAPVLRPALGSIVVGKGFAGELTSWDEKQEFAEVVDIEQTGIQVAAKQITSSFQVVAPEKKSLKSVIELYAKRSKHSGVDPSWTYITEALGAAVAAGTSQSRDDAYVITAEIINDALESSKAKAASK